MVEALAAAEQEYPRKRFYFLHIGYPAAVSFKNRTSPYEVTIMRR
jgi:hypothetical protein